jgi:N-acetylneuraminic acid mutarotase
MAASGLAEPVVDQADGALARHRNPACQQSTQLKLPAGHTLPVAALDSDADRPRHERGHVMPRGGWGASAAHQQGTAPAHPGSQWTPIASSALNVARASHAGAEINNSIFVLGGSPDRQMTRALTEVERLDKIGDPWQLLPSLNTGRGNPAAAALDGRLYAIGGYDQAGNALTSVEAIEPGQDTAWLPVADLSEPRGACAAAATQDRIYVTGGDDGTGAPSLNSLVVYDPGTDQWQTRASMITRRSNLKMVYLDPYIYAIGGFGTGPNDAPLNTVERYDPGSDTWTIVASMNTGRINVGTAIVGNQIVVVGGAGQVSGHRQPLQTSEIYDPAADAWTNLDPLLDPGRGGVTSAAVQGNRVLAIGGALSTAQGLVMTQEVDRSPNVHHHN